MAREVQWRRALCECDDLIEHGQLTQAKELLSGLHRLRPDSFEVQELLLDVLFGQGLNEHDFDWVEVPSVVRLGRSTRDRIDTWLRVRGGWQDLYEVRFLLFWGEYLCFEEEALARDLARDDRFELEQEGPLWMFRATD